MGFRIFDPMTPLRSTEAREVGHDWFDLITHTLRRGVRIDLALCDFDPVAASKIHRLTWRSIRMLLAAAELAGPEAAPLNVIAAMHPARIDYLPRVLLYGHVRGELRERSEWLAEMAPGPRARAVAEMPGLVRHIVPRGDSYAPKAWPLAALVPTTHHQKLAVFDREWLYIGGLDLDERRYDDWSHDQPGPQTWHDVQVLLRGPAAQDAHDHLGRFLDEVAGRRPVAPSAGRLLRTLSGRRPRSVGASMAPKPLIDELAQLHYRETKRAERFIYLESQFFRDRRMAHALADAARANPALHCILILPAAPEDVAFQDRRKIDARFGEFLQAHCLRKIRRAFGSRLFIGCPAQRRREQSRTELGRDVYAGAPLVYVHAKVSVFDDRLAVISSANLNGRSMRWDTEAGIAFDDPADVTHLRGRCFEHWLPPDAEGPLLSAQTATGAWARLAARNASLPPAARRGFILPYEIKPGEIFGRGLPGVPEEMV